MAESKATAAPGEKARERRTDEVREQQIEAQTDNVLTNVPPQGSDSEVLGTSVSGKKEKELHVEQVGGDTIVSIGNQSVRFTGAEGAAALARKFRGVGAGI